MNASIKRANAKKAKYKKYLDKPGNNDSDSDSDGDISDEDVEIVEGEMLGTIIGEKYLVAKYIGRGTFSKVWALYNFETKQFVAGKIFTEEYSEQYTNELIILRQYSTFDPNSKYNASLISNFTDTFDNDKINVIIIPLYGKSVLNIHKRLRDNGNCLSLDSCKNIIKSLCESIVKLHELNVLHMDIKTDNVLVNNSPNDDHNNSINMLQKIITDNEYDNFIENKSLQEQKNICRNLKGITKNQKKKQRKKIKIRVHKLLKKDYLEKFRNVFGEEEEEKGDGDEKEENGKIVDLSEYSYILTDYSNSILEKEVSSNEFYQVRANRAPENILSITYNKRSESWAIGTTFWQLLTGEDLFEPDLNKYKTRVERDRKQLALMETYLGKIPQAVRMDCSRSFELYDENGELLKTKKVERVDIQEKLKKCRPDLSETDVYHACAFMIECWKYEYLKRLSPKELAEHPYINPIKEEEVQN